MRIPRWLVWKETLELWSEIYAWNISFPCFTRRIDYHEMVLGALAGMYV